MAAIGRIGMTEENSSSDKAAVKCRVQKEQRSTRWRRARLTRAGLRGGEPRGLTGPEHSSQT